MALDNCGNGSESSGLLALTLYCFRFAFRCRWAFRNFLLSFRSDHVGLELQLTRQLHGDALVQGKGE